MCSLPMSKAELGLITVAAGGLLVNWLGRTAGDEVVTLGHRVTAELEKTGLKDEKILEALIEEFYQLTKDVPQRPSGDIYWTLAFPIYQLKYYIVERNALQTVVKKAMDIVQANPKLKG